MLEEAQVSKEHNEPSTQAAKAPSAAGWRLRLLQFQRLIPYLFWCLYLLGWSAALLTPNPGGSARSLIPREHRFLVAKVIHVAAYTTLAALTGWLPVRPPQRSLLALFLFCHAFGTEFLQRFVSTRTPSWRDVALNCFGLCLGMALTFKWWRFRTSATCSLNAIDGGLATPAAGDFSGSPARAS